MARPTQPGTGSAVSQTQNSVSIKTPVSRLEKAFLAFTTVLGAGVVGSLAAIDNWHNRLNVISLALSAIGTVGVSALGWLLSKRTARDIALANLEAQQAGERAEAARLETEKVRALYAWRRVSEAQAQRIIMSLGSMAPMLRPQIVIQFVPEPESVSFSQDLENAFRAAGCQVKSYGFMGMPHPFGLTLEGPRLSVLPLRNVLLNAGIDVDNEPPTHGDLTMGPVLMVVGSRPPPNSPV